VSQVFEYLVTGLSLGCIYALIAMGFVIVFKATNVVNFAHASVLMLGAYLVATWHDGLGFFGALIAAAAVCAVAAALIDVILVRPLRNRRGGLDALAILTIAINVLIATELTRQVGTDILPTGAPWGSDTTSFLGITVPQTRIAAAVIAIALMVAFWAAFKYSDWAWPCARPPPIPRRRRSWASASRAWPPAPGRSAGCSPRSRARSSRASQRPA
jgi:branched-chain amino acid transport system permease protein